MIWVDPPHDSDYAVRTHKIMESIRTEMKTCDSILIITSCTYADRRPPQLYPCMSNYKHGVDDLIIQKEFGHKDLRTTQQCYCYDLTTDEERYEKIAQSLA